MCISAYLILRWLDASVVVLSAHNQNQAGVPILGSPHMVERLGCVPVQALLPAILLAQPESHPAQYNVPGTCHTAVDQHVSCGLPAQANAVLASM